MSGISGELTNADPERMRKLVAALLLSVNCGPFIVNEQDLLVAASHPGADSGSRLRSTGEQACLEWLWLSGNFCALGRNK